MSKDEDKQRIGYTPFSHEDDAWLMVSINDQGMQIMSTPRPPSRAVSCFFALTPPGCSTRRPSCTT